MKIETVKMTLKGLIESGSYLPTMLWGAMGIGKSEMIAQLSDELGYSLIDLRLSQLDPVDLRGLPVINPKSGKMEFSGSSLLPDSSIHGDFGILFLDEFNCADQAVMKSAYELINDRRLGDYRLPAGWVVIAAGNRKGDGGLTTKLPKPVSNRFYHIEIEPDISSWSKWAMGKSVDPALIAFLNYRSEFLFQAPEPGNEQGFCTPRSWSMVDKILKSTLMPCLEILEGCVGKPAAVDFLAFYKYLAKLPNLDLILSGKFTDKKITDYDLDCAYAATVALSLKTTHSNINHALDFLEGSGELQKLLVSLSGTRDKKSLENEAVVSLSVSHI